MSWADEVEVEAENETRASIWHNFNISKNAIVCYVLGAHPPFSVLNGYIQRLWGKLGINKNGIILVRFDSVNGKNEAIQRGIYHFDNETFIVMAWNPDMKFTRKELYIVPIWVKLPGLDFKYWSPKGLSKIGSLIRKSLMVDQNTEKKVSLNFARLLIEVEVDTKLPDKVFFRNEKGMLIEQKINYDWKPILCKYFHKYGHNEEDCRKKKGTQALVQQKEQEKSKMVKTQVETELGGKKTRVQVVKEPNGKGENGKNKEGWVTRQNTNKQTRR
nr:uncharacterized protein LOC104092659 [Nicotiana tomentosiformis]